MSRSILQLHESYKENPLNNIEAGKVIITSCMGKEIALLLRGNRLLSAHVLDNDSKIGAIYIGKVKNVVKNLNACFVEIAEGELCFLPFGEANHPLMINRPFDGRLLQGDEILVQVQRDPVKTKQAALTCHISLPNDLFVFSIGSSKLGISSKLSKEIKAQIKEYLLDRAVIDQSGSYIQSSEADFPEYSPVIRTEAGKLFAENKDLFLQKLKEQAGAFIQMLEKAKHRTCFSVIQAPKKPYNASLLLCQASEYQEVLTDLPEAYTSLQGQVEHLRLYEDASFPLGKLYSLDTKLKEALSKTIWLKSGANLVIEQTECLTTIDVNSGKMIKGTVNDEVIRTINEEAAKEAALQIRLRNLSGIIIIDFINMKNKSDEVRLLQLMKELTGSDNVTTTVVDITPLGLMELTRKKVNKSLKEQLE